MKVITNLGGLGNNRTALIIDNPYFPYYIVNGYNGKTEGDDLWAWTVAYYDNIYNFAKAITDYAACGQCLGFSRVSEIASEAINHIIELDPDEAKEWLEDELGMEEEEMEYFCVDDNIRETLKVWGQPRNNDNYEEWN